MKKYRILQYDAGGTVVYFVQKRRWLFFWTTAEYGGWTYNTARCTDYYRTVDLAKSKIWHLQMRVAKSELKTKVVEYL
jgi:hypothetical protein